MTKLDQASIYLGPAGVIFLAVGAAGRNDADMFVGFLFLAITLSCLLHSIYAMNRKDSEEDNDSV